jgi:hypothetical protein
MALVYEAFFELDLQSFKDLHQVSLDFAGIVSLAPLRCTFTYFQPFRAEI